MVFVKSFYGRKYRSSIGWFDAFKMRPWSTDMLKESMVKVGFIQEKSVAVQNRHKDYIQNKVIDLHFKKSQKVLLNISPMKVVMQFGKKGKLSLRCIRPIEILRKVGLMAYRLALPPIVSIVHQVFYVSMLKKYHGDRIISYVRI